ncbi:adaptor-related protein complex [Planoprotostelium fungivorum]|uniref:AP complex subunit sigma n=1 Tax=Planoprotostelium fungivorum TaxID=1890364 RepID=A0A2P6N2N9_9EUKA|nr:adaptor-related protein complex [Planoprotostelium fungivorum]
MIKAIMIINTSGKPRLVKFYERKTEQQQQALLKEVYNLISKRADVMCNFLEADKLENWGGKAGDTKIIYRHYATLYFIFVADGSESELGILDLKQRLRQRQIQTFVETLDKCFRNVCELDLVFHVDKVHFVLDEIICGGMVLETRISEIFDVVTQQKKLEAQENPVATAKGDIKNFFGEFGR